MVEEEQGNRGEQKQDHFAKRFVPLEWIQIIVQSPKHYRISISLPFYSLTVRITEIHLSLRRMASNQTNWFDGFCNLISPLSLGMNGFWEKLFAKSAVRLLSQSLIQCCSSYDMFVIDLETDCARSHWPLAAVAMAHKNPLTFFLNRFIQIGLQVALVSIWLKAAIVYALNKTKSSDREQDDENEAILVKLLQLFAQYFGMGVKVLITLINVRRWSRKNSFD